MDDAKRRSAGKGGHDLLSGEDDRLDITLARKYLKWEPKIQLAEGLKRTIAYFKTKV